MKWTNSYRSFGLKTKRSTGLKTIEHKHVSEKAVRGIMAEGDPTAHVPRRRRYGSHEGEATPAPGNLADRDFTAKSPNEKRPADITRDIKAGDGKGVPLAAGRLP